MLFSGYLLGLVGFHTSVCNVYRPSHIIFATLYERSEVRYDLYQRKNIVRERAEIITRIDIQGDDISGNMTKYEEQNQSYQT